MAEDGFPRRPEQICRKQVPTYYLDVMITDAGIGATTLGNA